LGVSLKAGLPKIAGLLGYVLNAVPTGDASVSGHNDAMVNLATSQLKTDVINSLIFFLLMVTILRLNH